MKCKQARPTITSRLLKGAVAQVLVEVRPSLPTMNHLVQAELALNHL